MIPDNSVPLVPKLRLGTTAAKLRLAEPPIASPPDEAEQGLLRLHREENGMITIISVVTFLFFLLLANLVWNTGWTTTTKIQTQNASDAASYSTALWMARGHNAITATNHIMGEMMAFVIVRAALGERHDKRLDHADIPEHFLPKRFPPIPVLMPGNDDKHQDRRFQNAGPRLTDAYDKVDTIKATIPPIAYRLMDGKPEVRGSGIEMGSAISDGRYYLVKILTIAYETKFIATILEKTGFPPAVAVGKIMDAVALAVDVMVMAEWIGYQVLEVAYRSTQPLHDVLWNRALEGARQFQEKIVKDLPKTAFDAGKKIASDNFSTGAIYPAPGNSASSLKFYMENDVFGVRGRADNADQQMRKSQIVRATYPWVMYHRRPLAEILNWMLLSRGSYHFVFWTNDLTLVKCRERYNTSSPAGVSMFFPVLAGSDPSKYEIWKGSSTELERRHAVVGFAHHKTPRYSAPRVLGNPLPKGIATYSMALVYNANERKASSGSERQPNWGWDTLNWDLPTAGSFAFEIPEKPCPERNGRKRFETGQRPKIKLNWQAKLVPVSSYINTAIPATSGPQKELLMRFLVIPPGTRQEFQTH